MNETLRTKLSVYLQHLRPTLILAVPIIVGQLSQMLMGIVDSVMLGHLGTVPLAASAFTGSVFMFLYVTGSGLLLPISVLVSRSHGAGDERECGEWWRHGVWLGLVTSLVLWGFMQWIGAAAARLGQPPEVVQVLQPYHGIIAFSMIPALGTLVKREFVASMGFAWVVTIVQLAGVALNALLNWVLIFGHLGAPALGLVGAGWATWIARMLTWLVLLVWVNRAEFTRAARPERWLQKTEWKRFREMLHIGGPTAAMLLFEAGAFSFAAIMMGWLGTMSLAAHQVTLSCVTTSFMLPLGVSAAVGMRVSRAHGAGRSEDARAIALGALGMTACVMALFALFYLSSGRVIAGWFTHDNEVILLASRLLAVAGLFQIVDGVQVVSSGALRGVADVRWPLVIALVAYWGVALPFGWLAGVRGPLGPIGVWVGLALGLGSAAVLLALRVRHRLKV